MRAQSASSWFDRCISGPYWHRLGLLALMGLFITAVTTGTVLAQEAESEGSTVDDMSQELEEVVVSATRSDREKKQLPESVTVIDQEELEKASAVTSDLGQIISNKVPGMSPSTESFSNYGQSLRGRNFQMLIDGVAQGTPLRDGFRELRTIDPSAIQRVEVIRGATAIYGYGAAGGLINVVTKDTAEEDEQRLTLETKGSEHDLSESLGGYLEYERTLARGENQFRVGAGYGITGLFYDGEGDIVPSNPYGQGGLASSNQSQIDLKWKRSLDDRRSWSLSANHYRHFQDRDYSKVNGNPTTGQKATVVKGAPGVDDHVGSANTNLKWTYNDEELLGYDATFSVYHQNFLTRFDTSPMLGAQSQIDEKKYGARMDFNGDVSLPANQKGSLLWGIDFLNSRTQQETVQGDAITPEMDQTSWAPFAQLEVPAGENWLFRAGLRHERLSLEFPTFTQFPRNYPGITVQGGELDYSKTVGNLGAVWYLTDAVDLHASFSQSFSVSEIGRVLRGTTKSSLDDIQTDAQIVDNYELGLRGNWPSLNYELTGFFSESELGTTYDGSTLDITRRPEQIWGLELSLDQNLSDRIRWGTNMSWMEGRQDADDDGSYESQLPNTRISPPKVNSYVEHETTESLANRLDVRYWADRTRFDDSGFGQGDIKAELLFDYLMTYQLDQGRVRFGIENLLDEFHFPPLAQGSEFGSYYYAGKGRNFKLTYEYRW